MEKHFSLLLSTLLLLCANSFAQNTNRINGHVRDTAKNAIKNAQIVLMAEKDTLRTATNDEGYFTFSNVPAGAFSLKIHAAGHESFNGKYAFGEKNVLELSAIELKKDVHMLKEVVIKSKPNPVRIMQDTVEYNAAAYQVLEGDNVSDLLKQLPGLEVDDDYNVKTMGKQMTKLRINGKDFFTSNVKDFIDKLPAGIVSKIQVIDDFGDMANFTGIKGGEPIKLLNIVTKPDMNHGIFGGVSATAGTNEQFVGGGTVNQWKETRQRSAGVNYNTSNNGAGTAQVMGINASHNEQVNKNMRYGVSYGYGRNNNAFTSEQAMETLNPLGTFYSKSRNEGENKNDNHNLNSNIHVQNKKLFLDGNITASYSNSDNNNNSTNNQWGVIKQDIANENRSTGQSPTFNARMNFARVLKDKKSHLSAEFGLSGSSNQSNQFINTHMRFYDKVTEALEKDSILNRNLITDNSNRQFQARFNYSIGLKQPKDTLARQSLNLSYGLSAGKSASTVQTYVLDQLDSKPSFVDSLSTDYTSVNINQTIGLSYAYAGRRMRYNLGMNANPNLLTSNYIHLGQKIRNNTLNYSPSININKTISDGTSISVDYGGSNNSPTIEQLQPVRNTVNLQNIVIGNPNLKPSFSHNLSSNFNYANPKTGLSVQAGINLNTVRNEIVNNVVLIPDTLNSYRQETRFENTNGNYGVSSHYMLNIPIKKNKYAIFYSGSFGSSNKAVFINNNKRQSKGLNVSQQLRGMLTLKKLRTDARISYDYTGNNNVQNMNPIVDVLGQAGNGAFFRTHNYMADVNSSLRLEKFNFDTKINYSLTRNDGEGVTDKFNNVQKLVLSFSAKAKIKKTYHVGVNAAKSINTGYSLGNTNPFIVNASFSKKFLKDQSLSFNVNANDILNQGNNLTRYVSGSSIIDRRTNQATQVFTVGLSYNISRFGGQHFQIDAD